MGKFDESRHFDELNYPLDTQEGVLSPTTRRARTIANLFGGSAAPGVTYTGPIGTGVDAGGQITLDTAETTIVAGDYLGLIDFISSAEASGTDAIALGARIAAVSEGTFTSSANPTALVFSAGVSEAATEKFRMTSAGDLLTTAGVGTVTTAGTTTVEEHGDRVYHTTVLSMTAFAVGTIVQSTSLGFGAKFYTFPAGAIAVNEVSLVGAFTSTGTTKTDAPEVGIGSVISSGAIATLTTATFEDFMDGGAAGFVGGDTVATDVNGTTIYKGSLGSAMPVMIKTTGGKSHDMFLNLADAWTGTSNGDVTFTGKIKIRWRLAS